MSSKTSLVASRYRLQEWAGMIMECQQRPNGITVGEWCRDHGISKGDYYYRLSRVRKTFLDEVGSPFEPFVEVTVSGNNEATVPAQTGAPSVSALLRSGGSVFEIYDNASADFLKKLMKAAADA